jgi:hypothetical protein
MGILAKDMNCLLCGLLISWYGLRFGVFSAIVVNDGSLGVGFAFLAYRCLLGYGMFILKIE